MVYYYLFGVFSILENYYFQVSFNLKIVLYVARITQKYLDLAPITFRSSLTNYELFIWAYR